jgi:hypothetical protein
MAKRSSPALYELIRHRTGERVPPTHHREPEVERAAPLTPSMNWLQPGRSVQMPVGYLFVAIAGVLILLILTYTFAFKRGVQVERMAFEAEYGLVPISERGGPLLDPLTVTDADDNRRSRMLTEPARPREQATGGRQWGPIASDPRQRGLAYYILAQTTEAGAMRLAEFCRDQGLEAYVVSGNNPRLRRVIALPGVPPDRATSDQARQLRQTIHDIGRSWSQAGLGRWDYHEAYLSEYR